MEIVRPLNDETIRQVRAPERLCERSAQGQQLEAWWPPNAVKGLVEGRTQPQALQARWPLDVVDGLVEFKHEGQMLQTFGPCDAFYGVIESREGDLLEPCDYSCNM